MMKEIRKEGRRFAKYHVTALGIEWEVGRKRETKRETLFYVTGASFTDDSRVKSVRYNKESGKAGRFSERMAKKIVADLSAMPSRSFNLAIIEAL